MNKMYYLYVVLITLLLIAFFNCQQSGSSSGGGRDNDNLPGNIWTRLLGAAGTNTEANGITSDLSANIYTTGYTCGNLDGQPLTGTRDLFVVKYDSDGNKLWTNLLAIRVIFNNK